MPRKASNKSNANPNNEEKPTRSKATRRTSTKRTAEQDKPIGMDIHRPNDYDKAFANAQWEPNEVF